MTTRVRPQNPRAQRLAFQLLQRQLENDEASRLAQSFANLIEILAEKGVLDDGDVVSFFGGTPVRGAGR
jgi:hypothetical protein